MPITLSHRITAIPPSQTIAVSNKAKSMKKEGIDVVSMSAGEPDFDTPDYIKAAAKDAIDKGYTKYTVSTGILELRQAVCQKLKNDNGLDYTPDQVICSSGGKECIYTLIQALIEPGDEVIIPSPYWVSYPSQVILAGGKPVILAADISTEFKISADQLAAAITPATKLFIFNSPSNPTGSVYTREEMQAIGEVLKKNPHIFVLTDEIYEHITYNCEHFSLPSLVPELIERSVVCNGVSKAWSMTGWRLGFAAGPIEVIKGMAKVQSQSTSHPSSISQWAAVAALNGPKDPIREMVKAFQDRRDYIVRRIEKLPGWKVCQPAGAFYVFPEVSGLFGKVIDGKAIGSSLDVANFLLDKHLVATVPGSAFGLEDYVRLSYATSLANIEKALDRIETATNQLLR